MDDFSCEYCLNDIDNLQITMMRTQEVCTLQDAVMVSEIRGAVSTLQDHFYAIFDLGLSKSDICVLNELHVTAFKDYSNNGQLEAVYPTLLDFIKLIDFNGRNEHIAEYIAALATRITNNIVDATGFEHTWMHGRGYVDISGYDKHNISYSNLDREGPLDWHIDKSFEEMLKPNSDFVKPHLVFLFTLKGSSTLYTPSTDEIRNMFWDSAEESELVYSVPSNSSIYGFLSDVANTTSFGKGTIHIAGKEGTIHGVPRSHERLVLVVSPNSEENVTGYDNFITELNRKWLEQIKL